MLINLFVSPLTSEWSTLTIHFWGINLEDIGNRVSIFVFPESFHHAPFSLRNNSFPITPKCFQLGLPITIYHPPHTLHYSDSSDYGHVTQTKPMGTFFGDCFSKFLFLSGGGIVTDMASAWIKPLPREKKRPEEEKKHGGSSSNSDSP